MSGGKREEEQRANQLETAIKKQNHATADARTSEAMNDGRPLCTGPGRK